jgi:hypothetical protein
MPGLETTFTEIEYVRIWGDYWLFCRKIRYGKQFLSVLLPGIAIATILSAYLNSELGIIPVLAMLSAFTCLVGVVGAFDYYKYHQYIKLIRKFYQNNEKGKEHEVNFDEQYFSLDENKWPWKAYKYYFSSSTYLYLFTSKSEISVIWSKDSIGDDNFNLMVSYVKPTLKILPASKKIWIK